ncbi:hypothetical protein GCM10010912_45060 [Paenibacillus albidus]|uniref:Fructose-bisphosphate aldolase n=1 Tax=Paenibacillus albidus TaxID=2041023 RepID=A0A917FQQ1_9BACL|nr:hypothetical protein GCM10010912_45060 [Paenibacillus albidus]
MRPNVDYTRQVVQWARATGASVEAELGHLGGGEAGTEQQQAEAFFTDVEQAGDFVSRTSCDALAVAIGTVHGVYRSEPRLDIKRLQDIYNKV